MTDQYVIYLRDDGTVHTHGGPYAPMKAGEVRDAMQSHLEAGRYRDHRIPEDTLVVGAVPPDRLRELRDIFSDGAGVVCPSGCHPEGDCHIDQRFNHGLACPHCACELVLACALCDFGASVERGEGDVPLCRLHDPLFHGEHPKGDTPEEDVACADCGTYTFMIGGLDMHGNVVEGGDMVCPSCARSRGLTVSDYQIDRLKEAT